MISRWLSGYQAHYFIIFKTYHRDDVRERDGQRDNVQNCHIFVERHVSFCARFRASHVALVFALLCALVCGQSRDFCVCRRITRRVHSRAFVI